MCDVRPRTPSKTTLEISIGWPGTQSAVRCRVVWPDLSCEIRRARLLPYRRGGWTRTDAGVRKGGNWLLRAAWHVKWNAAARAREGDGLLSVENGSLGKGVGEKLGTGGGTTRSEVIAPISGRQVRGAERSVFSRARRAGRQARWPLSLMLAVGTMTGGWFGRALWRDATSARKYQVRQHSG
ncbi:hypothetical protein BDY21DRAFT_149612 [Lineolata rhizophorae]|uniref:Uncharacterized protein n=1 Tax=Lineolata rhizophorae TaxID=578093 RepID=A0A6A6NN16_9PEZI|nr:hypothetical protein BDY21DRAFT_149612 [Lineolata rhizophorae]